MILNSTERHTDFSRVRLLIIFLIIGVIVFMLVGSLLNAIDRVRQGAARSADEGKLHPFVKGLHNHCSANEGAVTLPAAYRSRKEGEPYFSWRVALLPYMEQGPAFDRYDFTEPWNGPNNRVL